MVVTLGTRFPRGPPCVHAVQTSGTHWVMLLHLKGPAGRPQRAGPPPLPLPPLTRSLRSPHFAQAPTLPGIVGSWAHKGKSSGASLYQPQGKGVPGSKPDNLAILSSSRVWIFVGSLDAVAPCQGPGHSGFTHTLFCVHIIPQLSILRSKYAIFSSL